MEYGDHVEMFKDIKKNQKEETPLDHIPKRDFSYNWFIGAYNVLANSSNDSGGIPLSELKIFEDKFGLIGSFREFVLIIYSINETYSEFKKNKTETNQEL